MARARSLKRPKVNFRTRTYPFGDWTGPDSGPSCRPSVAGSDWRAPELLGATGAGGVRYIHQIDQPSLAVSLAVAPPHVEARRLVGSMSARCCSCSCQATIWSVV